MKKPLFLKLNLQFFADDESQETNTDDLDGESELFNTIQNLLNQEDSEDDSSEESEEEESDEEEQESEEESEEEQDEDEQEKEETDEDKGKKREQSREENARFAKERREREAEERAKRELERLKQEAPEFQLAKMLSEQYGQTPEEIIQQVREAQLQQEAKDRNLPVELLRERQVDRDRMQQLEDELNQIRYQSWQNQIAADTTKLQAQYKFLTQEDMDAAVDYILNTAQNVNIPLEQAVFAVHGSKIVQELANQKVQDDLAKQSGRKAKTPPPPNNGKPSKAISLTADEQYVAKQLGMTAEEYQKYK